MSDEASDLPDLAALNDLHRVWVGAVARAALGARRGHSPTELLVEAALPELRARLPKATPLGESAVEWGGVHVHAAPDGLEAGLRRRGVHLDAMGLRPDGTWVDPLGGRLALSEDRLDWDTPADEASAGLLGLRVLALASELGVAPTPAQLEALSDSPALVLRADRDFVRESMTTLLVGRRPAEALDVLERTRILNFVLPEAAALVDFHRSSRFHHKDVWVHTCTVVRQAIPRPVIRWAALLHDIAKPYTRTYEPPREVHFFHHDELGAAMFEGLAVRLRFPEALATRIRALILNHLRANLYVRTWSDSAVRRFGLEMGDLFEDLMHLSRADVTSKRAGRRREAIANLYDLRTRLARLQVEDALRKPQVPKGLGAAIIHELGVAPGPLVGDLRRVCEDAVRAGELPQAPEIEVCIRFLRARGAA